MSKEDLQARRYFVAGRVQGVGYRVFVQGVARDLELSGYVRNRMDARVEVLAMGTAERLNQLREKLEKGPLMARVTGVSAEPATIEREYAGDFSVEATF